MKSGAIWFQSEYYHSACVCSLRFPPNQNQQKGFQRKPTILSLFFSSFFCLLVHYKTKWETNGSINSPKYFFFFFLHLHWIEMYVMVNYDLLLTGKSAQSFLPAFLLFVFFSATSIIQGCCSPRANTQDVEQTSTLSKNKKKEYLMNKDVRRAVYSNASLPSCG